jgi:5-methylcytosine-specific restriction endonuclease McrA
MKVKLDDRTRLERRKASKEKYRKANPHKFAEWSRRFHERNPGKKAAWNRDWQRKNPEKARAHRARMDARKRNQSPDLSNAEKEQMLRVYSFAHELGPSFEVDHIVPLGKGGLHHPDNLQILTKTENRRKHTKLDYEPEFYIRIAA